MQVIFTHLLFITFMAIATSLYTAEHNLEKAIKVGTASYSVSILKGSEYFKEFMTKELNYENNSKPRTA